MLKIQIRSIYGGILFEYEKENNTRKNTVIEAVKTGADLRSAYLTGANLRSAYLTGADLRGANLRSADLTGANLTGAYLTGADLRGANLRSADLTGANLTGADLTGANLTGAYLTGADLRGANLRSADLTGANLTGAYLTGADLTGADLTGAYLTGADGEKITIKKVAVFTGLYKYLVIPFISEDNIKWVKMGCYTRPLKDWKKDFWNNHKEFTDRNSEESKLRLFAFKTAENWFKIIDK